MSKNIVIQEGGVGRQFTAQKLTTPLVGGGSCNWVPEDEIQLGTKYISENGVYVAADDGEYGYSQVNVNVNSPTKIITGSTDDGEPVVTTIDVVDGTISEIILGDYFIVTYDSDGNVAKIEDNNGNRCLLTYDGETLSGFDDIEDNHYTIILDSNGNISQVIDPNAQDCELRDSDGDGKIDIISIGAVMQIIPDIETGDIKIIDENDNDVTDDYIGTSITGVDSDDTPWRANIVSDVDTGGASVGIAAVTPATTPGASLSGIDTTTGNEAVATIDDNGNIVVESIPSTIKIETPPTKNEYLDGESIDFTGMVVKAYLKDGNLWTDFGHPNGVIPISELYFIDRKADIDKASSGTIKECADFGQGQWPQPISCVTGELRNTSIPNSLIQYDGYIAVLVDNGNYVNQRLCCTDIPGTRAYFDPGTGTYPWYFDVSATYTHNGKTVYYTGGSSGLTHDIIPGVNRRLSEIIDGGLNMAQAAWTIVYGESSHIGGQQDILVKWARPSDNEFLEDTFPIYVSENPDGGGDDEPPVPAGITIQDLNIAIYNAVNAGLDYIEIDGEQYSIDEAQAMIDYLISH